MGKLLARKAHALADSLVDVRIRSIGVIGRVVVAHGDRRSALPLDSQ